MPLGIFFVVPITFVAINALSYHSIGLFVSEIHIVAKPSQENLKIPYLPPPSLPSFHDLAWFVCEDLELCLSSEGKLHPFAGINKTSAWVDFPQLFKIDLNGTLTIVRVSPDYDGIVILCWAHFHGIGKSLQKTYLEIRGTSIHLVLSMHISIFRKTDVGGCTTC